MIWETGPKPDQLRHRISITEKKRRKFWVKKNWGEKIFGFKKNWSKEIFVQKIFWVKKCWVQKIFWGEIFLGLRNRPMTGV